MPSSIEYWSLTVGAMWYWHCAASHVDVRRLASQRVERRTSDVRVHACVRGVSGTQHVGCGRVASVVRNNRLRHASSPHLPPTSGQALCLMAGVYKFIMPSLMPLPS